MYLAVQTLLRLITEELNKTGNNAEYIRALNDVKRALLALRRFC